MASVHYQMASVHYQNGQRTLPNGQRTLPNGQRTLPKWPAYILNQKGPLKIRNSKKYEKFFRNFKYGTV
jgi:hypothetical protein